MKRNTVDRKTVYRKTANRRLDYAEGMLYHVTPASCITVSEACRGAAEGEPGKGITMADLLNDAKNLQPQIVAWRRDFHAHPELGFHETRTAAIVADELRRLGYKVRTEVGKTGVLADLDSSGAHGRIILRADMDALPIQEDSGEPFSSQNPGVCHACGHDSHTAMLLGAARLLMSRRANLKSSVRLMFQPCEESGPGGAEAMIQDGCLDGVDSAFALHVLTDWEAPAWGIRPGPIMASVDRITITVRGRGGHAATPERCADPVVGAAQAVSALQTVMSRRIGPLDAGILSLCSIHGGEAFNVIPDTVTVVGTIRSHSRAMRDRVKELCVEICGGVAQSCGLKIDVAFDGAYPATINDPAFTAKVAAAVRDLFGPDSLIEIEKRFGGEDFSCLLEKVPGAMIFLGAASKAKGICHPHHSAHFRIDEDVLWRGSALYAKMAQDHQ